MSALLVATSFGVRSIEWSKVEVCVDCKVAVLQVLKVEVRERELPR